MAHTIVRIIELLLANTLAAAMTAIFAIAIYACVHGLRTVGRHR